MRTHPTLSLVLTLALGACDGSVEPRLPLAASHDVSIDLARSAFPGTDVGRPRIDPNHGGRSAAIGIASLSYGRLADVHAIDPVSGESILVAEDLVIGAEIRSDGRSYEVDTDPITAITRVTLLSPIGTKEFEAAWNRLEDGLVPIEEKSLDPAELPPFPTLPRDAAIVVRFDDLIDPASIDAGSIELAVGTPPSERFQSRALVDRNHGGFDDTVRGGAPRFLPTRVILDTTISQVEALESPASLTPGSAGLPPSRTPALANVALRVAAGVRNLAGNGLVGGREIVRAMRSGSEDDPFHGFLADLVPPRIVGLQGVTVDAVAPDPQGGPQDFQVRLTFATTACASAARLRDVLETPGTMAVVTRRSAAPIAGTLARVHVRVVAGGVPATGPGLFQSAYAPALDQGREACFLRFSAPPLAPPADGISPDAQIAIRFSEPMNATTVSAFDTFTVTSAAQPTGPRDYVTGAIVPNIAEDDFRFIPQVPLNHAAGANEEYYVNLLPGAEGPTDLAGNPVRDALPQVSFRLDPSAPGRATGNYVLSFESTDEDGNGFPELRGQFLYDLFEGSIRARPVSRFAAVADRTQTVPSLMTPLSSGVQTPLNPLGSRLHALWRYCDVGMGLLDESFMNVDVEGLAWSPVGGTVVSDQYSRFEMSLAHTGRLPDEMINPATLLPAYPESGVISNFARNQLDAANDPLRVVHPRERGYTIDPNDLFVSSTGTTMMPWPLNRNLPPDQFAYYTWRDTALTARGAEEGVGAEMAIVVQATGSGTVGQPYAPGEVPTIGLPLLMEFKCFPDSNAIGTNALDVSIAINSSSSPEFRAYSSGGTNSSGTTVTVDPDLSTIATGGFNPASTPPGLPTTPTDNVFHIGQMDLVVRVSRLHAVWVDTNLANPLYAAPVVEPRPSDQPIGTNVVLAFRGATSAIPVVQADAGALDPYGESSVAGAVTFFNGDPNWKSSIAQLNGAKLVQVRASFVSNAVTGLTPSMTGLGLAYAAP